ncbi:hypothetical protein BDV98DRAFT_658381 [Pterulicium gracile]|uniref:Uncharacterized protein n=1 Tax=Pterulicium gracile TaxID=1884261 RepID=A0A5C3QHS2_9AGAR|nr:hypothetical protein BDV98DRAFT_658381 [Pterula gracilis]
MRFSHSFPTLVLLAASSTYAATTVDPKLAALLASAPSESASAFAAFIADAPLGSPQFAEKMALRKQEWDAVHEESEACCGCKGPGHLCNPAFQFECCTGVCIEEQTPLGLGILLSVVLLNVKTLYGAVGSGLGKCTAPLASLMTELVDSRTNSSRVYALTIVIFPSVIPRSALAFMGMNVRWSTERPFLGVAAVTKRQRRGLNRKDRTRAPGSNTSTDVEPSLRRRVKPRDLELVEAKVVADGKIQQLVAIPVEKQIGHDSRYRRRARRGGCSTSGLATQQREKAARYLETHLGSQDRRPMDIGSTALRESPTSDGNTLSRGVVHQNSRGMDFETACAGEGAPKTSRNAVASTSDASREYAGLGHRSRDERQASDATATALTRMAVRRTPEDKKRASSKKFETTSPDDVEDDLHEVHIRKGTHGERKVHPTHA